jgi:hypothetical protein
VPQRSLTDNKELASLQEIINQGLHNGKSRQEIFAQLKDNYRDTKTLATIICDTPSASQITVNIPW